MPLYAHIKTDRVDSWFRLLTVDQLEDPDQALETETYLDDLADMHRTALTQRLYNTPDLLSSMLAKDEHPQTTLKKKGVLYVNRVGGYYPDPSDNEIIEIKEFPQRPLEKDTGFTGWLDSNGDFYESIYGTHNQIAFNHDITSDENAIYLACTTSPILNQKTDTITLGIGEPTKQQKEWLITYLNQLSPEQRKIAKKWL